MDHILSIVLFTPLLGLLALLFIPSSNARAIKLWANAVALVGFLVSLPLVFQFGVSTTATVAVPGSRSGWGFGTLWVTVPVAVYKPS